MNYRTVARALACVALTIGTLHAAVTPRVVINVGGELNTGAGDSVRAAFIKVNTNFFELFHWRTNYALTLDDDGLAPEAFWSSNATAIADALGEEIDATIGEGAIVNTNLADMAEGTVKGRVSAGAGVPEDLTATQVRTLLNVADGATVGATWGTDVTGQPSVMGQAEAEAGSATTERTITAQRISQAIDALAPGAVWPLADDVSTGGNQISNSSAPTDPDHLVNKAYADSIVSAPDGTVVGPETSVDRAVPVFSGTTGTNLLSSPVTISAAGAVAGVGNLGATNLTVSGTAIVPTPTQDTHAATKAYVDAAGVGALPQTVLGPSSSTARRIPVFGDTTGTNIVDSGAAISADGDVTGIAQLTVHGNIRWATGDAFDVGPTDGTRPNTVRVGPGGVLAAGPVTSTGALTAGQASYMTWGARSRIYSDSDGTVRLSNAAETDFNRLHLGPATAGHVAARVDTASPVGISLRLGDDSAYAGLHALDITAHGTIKSSGIIYNTNGTFYAVTNFIMQPGSVAGSVKFTHPNGLYLDRINLGPAASTAPMLKINTTNNIGIQLRTGTDSAYANLYAGLVDAESINLGGVDLATTISDKLGSDAIEGWSIERITAAGTNTAKMNARGLEIDSPISTPFVQLQGGPVTLSLAPGTASYRIIATNNVTVTVTDMPASGDWSGYEWEFTNSLSTPINVEFDSAIFSRTKIYPGALGGHEVLTVWLSVRAGQLRMGWDGPQPGELQTIYGGTGNPKGVADSPEWTVQSEGIYNGTNYNVNFGQGTYSLLSITDELHFPATSGKPAILRGAVKEQHMEIENYTGATQHLVFNPAYVLLGLTNPYVMGASDKLLAMKWVAKGPDNTNVTVINLGGTVAASGGGEPDPGEGEEPWSGLTDMLAYYDFDEETFSSGVLDKHNSYNLNPSSSARFGRWDGGAPGGGNNAVTNYTGAAGGIMSQTHADLLMPSGGIRTYAFWLMRRGTGSADYYFGRYNTSFEVTVQRNSSLFNIRYSSNGTADTGGSTGVAFDTGVWYFVVLIVNDGTGDISYSINGSALAVQHSGVTINNSTEAFTVFGRSTASVSQSAFGPGGIWSRPLTQTEIEFLYNGGAAPRVYADFNAPE